MKVKRIQEKVNLQLQKREQKSKEQGITLIALVVTIIILLILVGVTLNLSLSENGLIKMSSKATKDYKASSESEALSLYILSNKLNNKNTNIGKKLLDRNQDNSKIWDIVVLKSENKVYGTGWNYIEKGTNIEGYGKITENWLINNETGEIIKLEDGSFEEFNYEQTVAVTDNLLYNLDSANVGFDKSSWGSNSTLYYYDNSEYDTDEEKKAEFNKQIEFKSVTENNAGYDRKKSLDIENYLDDETKAFKFNGNNYIEVKNEDGFDFTNGLTFEFYGRIYGSNYALNDEKFVPFFSLWNGNYNDLCPTRMGYSEKRKRLSYMLKTLFKSEEGGEWSHDDDSWNQEIEMNDVYNRDLYLTITIGKENEQYEQNIYIDNKEKLNGWLSTKYYEEFVELAKTLKFIEFGRCTNNGSGNWQYLKGVCYVLRIYNEKLDDEQVRKNYDKTTTYHQFIKEN